MQLSDELGALVVDETLFDQLRADWGFHPRFSLNDALEKWARLVSDVEVGYPLSLYDYEAELAFREDLEPVFKRLPSEVAQPLVRRLRELDERFFAATVPSKMPLLAPLEGGAAHPIWFRQPAKLRCVDEDVANTWRT